MIHRLDPGLWRWLGALVRNQVAAVVGALVWMTAVQYTVIIAFPAV